ncbi:SDR family oxidoreductase [Liberiplasma polymorphum]|uniref:SDR family oxidoreductase n=1 Tax=Liberiplasma polymorphum TaxID=3374570 RepID=UPI003771BBA2
MSYNFPKNTQFLVTGCAGFIGSNLTEYILSLGYKVKGLDNFLTGKKENMESFIDNSNFSFINGDIRDKQTCINAVQNIDYVLHQAALGSVPRSIADPYTSHDVNVNGYLNMLLAARNSHVKRFVYASSSSVYGDHPTLPKVEGVEGKILSPYALTKHIDEEYGRLFYELYSFPTIGLRYFNVFGKRQDPNSIYAAVIPIFIKKLLNNEQPTINGDGTYSRDFTYVQNVIDANLKACLSDKESLGKSYNIAFGGRVTLNELYRELNSSLNIWIEPKYGSIRPGDIPHSNADITRARKILGYHPTHSFYDGIKLAIDWYKNNL